jgi:hypothetical protein
VAQVAVGVGAVVRVLVALAVLAAVVWAVVAWVAAAWAAIVNSVQPQCADPLPEHQIIQALVRDGGPGLCCICGW